MLPQNSHKVGARKAAIYMRNKQKY